LPRDARQPAQLGIAVFDIAAARLDDQRLLKHGRVEHAAAGARQRRIEITVRVPHAAVRLHKERPQMAIQLRGLLRIGGQHRRREVIPSPMTGGVDHELIAARDSRGTR
jgi:hypothetical protein